MTDNQGATSNLTGGVDQAPSVEEARRTLQNEAEKRASSCKAAIEAVLEQHKCTLDVSMVVTVRGVLPVWRVLPKQEV